MKLLITGITGKIGQNFLAHFLDDAAYSGWDLVALCNNRVIEQSDRVSVIKGSIADAETIDRAMVGVTHVLHMAAVKESPDLVVDVAIKGMFVLLEAFRKSDTAQQFILIGGDCSVGHIFHDYPAPITEESPRKAYQGCYALAKVVEEVMLEQYQFQYGINGCILRFPWIMEKDDFKCAWSFGADQFGGPDWVDFLPQTEVEHYASGKFAPVMLDCNGQPLLRNFIHVDDVVTAITAVLDNPDIAQNLFNISMNEPVNYATAAEYLMQTRDYVAIELATPFHSNWLSNAKARKLLRWEPKVTLTDLIDRAWEYRRDANDPRKIWYPG